jgi:hypothetical protein
MTQNARAMLKLEARLSQVRNSGGVYVRDRCNKIEKTFPPKNQNPKTRRPKSTKNPAKR